MIYAGIGSRETPKEILQLMDEIAIRLAHRGWTLRTGGAPGADDAFFDGAFGETADIEVYLPWDGFNDYFKNDLLAKAFVHTSPLPEAFEIAAKYHPAWPYLKQGAKKLMARNSHQVLGKDLDTPADCIICWTEGAKLKGGTAQALRMAEDLNIPVYNLGDYLTRKLFADILQV